MESTLPVLLLTTLTIAVAHTAAGPDHYLPFIVLSKSEGWSIKRTLAWTVLCGLGHLLSSMLIGAVGIAAGWSLGLIESLEGMRGDWAAWGLMTFGAAYLAWGLIKAKRGHCHLHTHEDGTIHAHPHGHLEMNSDVTHLSSPHDGEAHQKAHTRTLWALFLIFVLGPCEPLIPLLMVPAAEHSLGGILLVALIFGSATILTMIFFVMMGVMSLKRLRFGFAERYVHALSGGAIFLSGAAITFLGL